MAEHLAPVAYYFQVHLLYASIVWLAALALTSTRQGSATTKYWIWLACSLNFIVPVGAIADALWAPHLRWARPFGVLGEFGLGIARCATPVAAAWLVGACVMLTRLLLRIRSERRRTPLPLEHGSPADGIPVRFCARDEPPAVEGVLRPRIALPRGIDQLLTDSEFSAVLIHELAHAKRRDNLWRLVHEAVLCLLWFFPLVWIAGRRLALYREISCDEAVIRRGRARDLVSALAKLSAPEKVPLLSATASSLMGDRLARLTTDEPPRTRLAASALLVALFVGTLAACVLGTVAHTACCFATRL